MKQKENLDTVKFNMIKDRLCNNKNYAKVENLLKTKDNSVE